MDQDKNEIDLDNYCHEKQLPIDENQKEKIIDNSEAINLLLRKLPTV
jgi:hypothetical protein